MEGGRWYYCNAERDTETVHGPISLERLCEHIRSGELPYDVLFSPEPTPGPSWVEADTVEEDLHALPLDRERLIQEYIDYGEAPDGEENYGWASDRVYSLLDALPELAWDLIVEMIDRAPSDNSLGFVAASPLERPALEERSVLHRSGRAAYSAKCKLSSRPRHASPFGDDRRCVATS